MQRHGTLLTATVLLFASIMISTNTLSIDFFFVKKVKVGGSHLDVRILQLQSFESRWGLPCPEVGKQPRKRKMLLQFNKKKE